MLNRLNGLIILLIAGLAILWIIGCTGGQVGDTDVCPGSESALECLIMNNETIPAFYTEFDMLYVGGGEQQNLVGMAYVDSKNDKFYIEMKAIDILMFKGVIVGDEIKILYRTDTDSFEGIVGKLSKLRLDKYTMLDFDIQTLLKVISLKVPVLDEYKTIDVEYTDDSKQYIMSRDNILDKVTFYEQIPKVKYLVRGVYQTSDLDSPDNDIEYAFSYRYYDRAYKKEVFNGRAFYFSQKTSLTYYYITIDDGDKKREERKITIGLRNNIRFSDGFDDSTFKIDFPDGITIHYEN